MTCFKKCFGDVREVDLSSGEGRCTDSCTAKYMQARNVMTGIIQPHLIQQQGEKQAQQMGIVKKEGRPSINDFE